MNIDIAILTPVEVEYNAVHRHLSNLAEHRLQQGLYEIGNFVAKVGNLSIVIHQTNMLTSNMAAVTERTVSLFNPKIILLVGIGGGVKDVKIGDIVVATHIYAYQATKETEEGSKARPLVRHFNPKTLDIARSVIRQKKWGNRTSHLNTTFFNVKEGAIASGDKLIATSKSELTTFLDRYYNDTLAVDMEAAGFIEALMRYETTKALCIRGVSDLLENKTLSDKVSNQKLAAENAAAFAFELIYELKDTDLEIIDLKPKPILEEKKGGVDIGINIGKNIGTVIGIINGTTNINIPKKSKK